MATVSIKLQAEAIDAERGIRKVDAALEDLGNSGKGAGLKWTELKSQIDLATKAVDMMGAGFRAVGTVVNEVIAPTVEYAKQVRDLGSFAGITSEESSKLIQVTDDLGIEFSTLRTAARNLADEGLQPSVETLAELADEFTAIEDPVEASQFRIEKFGARAGPQMAYALSQGGDAIREYGTAVEGTALIMDERAVQAARDYELALDGVEDSIMAVKVATAEDLLPPTTELLNMTGEMITAQSLLAEAYERGQIPLHEMVILTMQNLTGTRDYDELIQIATQHLKDYEDALPDAKFRDTSEAVFTAADGTNVFGSEVVKAADKLTGKLNPALDDTKKAAEGATGAMDDLKTIVAGEFDRAIEDHEKSQAELAEEIAATTAELDKYKAMHGQVSMVTTDTAEANRELIIAQANEEKAARSLAEAQKKLSENTDPEQQLQLMAAVARADGALISASAKVDEWNGKLAESGGTFVTDYSTKIGELEGDLGELQGAYDENATAHEDSIRRMIFNMAMQRAYEDGEYTPGEQAFLTAMAERWNLAGADTALAIFGIDEALGNLATGNVLAADMAVDALVRKLLGLPPSGTTWDYYVNVYSNGFNPAEGFAPGGPAVPASPVDPDYGAPYGYGGTTPQTPSAGSGTTINIGTITTQAANGAQLAAQLRRTVNSGSYTITD
jgi:hypothetical protein